MRAAGLGHRSEPGLHAAAAPRAARASAAGLCPRPNFATARAARRRAAQVRPRIGVRVRLRIILTLTLTLTLNLTRADRLRSECERMVVQNFEAP